MNINIIKASIKNIDEVSELFNLYRQFYKYKSDINSSKKYITDRIINKESTIFLALNDKNIHMGFVQIYESFDSLNLDKIIILYDLYVKKEYRKFGIAFKLMKKSEEFAKSIGAKEIQLSTAKNNSTAQSLY